MEAVNRFGRLVTAMVTPLRPDLSVDLAQAAALARFLVEQGSQSLVVAGTTGESPTLSTEEKLGLFRTVKEAVGDRAAVIGGTGSNDTAASVALTQQAAATGLDGVMAVVPYYNKPSQEGMYQHFRAIAGATDLPVMLYNVPGRTGANLGVDTVARLADLPNVLAIKEASGNFDQATEIIRRLPHLALYGGDDGLTLPLLSIGAVGVVSVAAHIAGPVMREMIEAYLCGHRIRAMELHLALADLNRTLFIASNPVPVKEALSLIGLEVGPVRPPLSPLTGPERAEVSRCITQLQSQLWSMIPRLDPAPRF
ncbi:MAG: 4-hydroxy-tetrahydrodipicolinate synthase [Bacillota bacterium]